MIVPGVHWDIRTFEKSAHNNSNHGYEPQSKL